MTATDRTDYLLIVTETMLKIYKQLYFANLHKTNSTWIGGRSPTMAKEERYKLEITIPHHPHRLPFNPCLPPGLYYLLELYVLHDLKGVGVISKGVNIETVRW